MNYYTFLWAVVLSASLAVIQSAHAETGSTTASDASLKACQVHGIKRDLSFLVAPIKTQRDLDQHVLSLRKEDVDSPLRYLPRNSRGKFVSSITFNEKGITGYNYDILERELTLSQVYEVLALFGQQYNIGHMKAASIKTDLDMEISRLIQLEADSNKGLMNQCGSSDHKGYACTARATCSSSYTKICMSSC